MIFFRFPFGEEIFTINENSGETAVSFVSFDQKNSLSFNGKIEKISREKLFQQPFFGEEIPFNLEEFYEENENEYTEKIGKVIDFIKENKLPKLVISRVKFNQYEHLNLTESFLKLCENYPNAFAYLFLKDGKCWMGAFSEILGKFNKETHIFETMSLAGTIAVDENWTEKEIEEQKPVSNYISNILSRYSPEVQRSETHDHVSGSIKHLRTDFKTKINPENLEKIIEELHPTPAVCGIPKEFCKDAIEKFETHPRSFYAGYIRLETEKEIQYFVNLRCAEFFGNAALIHVGGGITAQSDPQKEWRETELKSRAILDSLVF